MMEKIILVCEPDCSGGKLSRKGLLQIRELVKKLISHTREKKVFILSSPEEDIALGAEVLGQFFGAAIWVRESLRMTDPPNPYGVIETIINIGNVASILILVLHQEYCKTVPKFYGEIQLKRDFPGFDCQKGEAVVIDRKNKTAELITNKIFDL